MEKIILAYKLLINIISSQYKEITQMCFVRRVMDL